MNLNFDINMNFSLLGLVIIGLLVWGGYRGYKNGGVVMGLSVFAIGGVFMIAALITKMVYTYFWKNGSNVPHIFGSITLGLTFIVAIWYSQYVQRAVKKRTGENNDIKNKIVGAIFGVVKYFIIVAVYSVVILNLNKNGDFLPDRERESYFVKGSAWVLTKVIKPIRMDKHETGPLEYPTDFNVPQNNGIHFPKTNNTNNNNSNTNNDTKPNNNVDVINEVNDEENF